MPLEKFWIIYNNKKKIYLKSVNSFPVDWLSKLRVFSYTPPSLSGKSFAILFIANTNSCLLHLIVNWNYSNYGSFSFDFSLNSVGLSHEIPLRSIARSPSVSVRISWLFHVVYAIWQHKRQWVKSFSHPLPHYAPYQSILGCLLKHADSAL